MQIADEALPAAAKMAKRYVVGMALPASALAVLHRACAMLKLAGQTQAAFRPNVPSDTKLDEDDVAVAVSAMTGIPVSKLGVDERARYAHIVDAMHQRIINQEEAVLAVSRAVKIARVGLKDPKRPIGSFLFLGPTGVGKTELAKALADFMFGDENAMVVLDMSEYQQDHTVNRLIGAPPGYVGYEGGGQLTDKVRQRPSTVVLFDEVEKAHPRVLDVLLQILEEGRLTDAQGRVASFSETVIILTSNAGSQYLDQPVMTDAMRELVMATVRSTFRPEFLNRLDEIILFLPLTADHLRKILDLMLKSEVKLLEGQGVSLEISRPAREWLLAQNDHPEWGARPLRRIIQKFLREPLADWMLAATPSKGVKVLVDAGAEGLVFSTETRDGEETEGLAAPAGTAGGTSRTSAPGDDAGYRTIRRELWPKPLPRCAMAMRYGPIVEAPSDFLKTRVRWYAYHRTLSVVPASAFRYLQAAPGVKRVIHAKLMLQILRVFRIAQTEADGDRLEPTLRLGLCQYPPQHRRRG